MYKLAQLKEAEVRGVVAALVDNGVLQVNSPEQFEKVASDTAALIDGYDYDISDVAQAAQYSMQKTASADAVTEAMGELTLHKLAGDINDDEFNYIAANLMKQAGAGDDLQYWLKDKVGMNSPADTVRHYGSKSIEKAQDAVGSASRAAKSAYRSTKKKMQNLGNGISESAQDLWKSLKKKIN